MEVKPIHEEKIADHIREILKLLNYSLKDENFKETPKRVAKWLIDYEAGFKEKPEEILKTRFPAEFEELIIVKQISFTSLCAHHMLPFRGKAHVGYIAQGHVIGLSKLARLVIECARKMTMQEVVTREIADSLMEHMQPKGVMVVLEAEHMCMSFRGVKDPHALTTTSAVRGCFLDNKKGSKDEFLKLIGR